MKILIQLVVAVAVTALIAAAVAGEAVAKIIVKGKTVIRGGKSTVK